MHFFALPVFSVLIGTWSTAQTSAFVLTAEVSDNVTTLPLLIDFQVAQPPPIPQGLEQCTIQILEQVLTYKKK